MRIVMRDERVLHGTALQIVRAMQDIAFGVERLSLAQYIEWIVTNALKFEEVELNVEGASDEELAKALIGEMIRTGLVRRG